MSVELIDEPSGIEYDVPPGRIKYQCPSDFTSYSYRPCGKNHLKNLTKTSTEIWLIKAPISFNPNSLSGLKIPLAGFETVQARTGSQKATNYSILSSPVGAESMHLLSASDSRGSLVCGPTLSGLINICENAGDSLGNQAPSPLPACPAPRIPDGLKQRFAPFGNASTSGPGTARHKVKLESDDPGGVGQKRSKKKKRKEKEDVDIKEEAVEEMVTVEMHKYLHSEAVQKDRKKKRQKSKEQKGASLSTREVEVKTEP